LKPQRAAAIDHDIVPRDCLNAHGNWVIRRYIGRQHTCAIQWQLIADIIMIWNHIFRALPDLQESQRWFPG